MMQQSKPPLSLSGSWLFTGYRKYNAAQLNF